VLASRIRLSDLETYCEHEDAIESIEIDYHNIKGGFDAWDSGWETYLTITAQAKVDAIRKRMDRLFTSEDD